MQAQMVTEYVRKLQKQAQLSLIKTENAWPTEKLNSLYLGWDDDDNFMDLFDECASILCEGSRDEMVDRMIRYKESHQPVIQRPGAFWSEWLRKRIRRNKPDDDSGLPLR